MRLPREVSIVVADTTKKRHLGGSEYNTRTMECENAVVLSNIRRKNLRALRDVSFCDLARAAEHSDPTAFGALMNESQSRLRNDYEASSPEMDLMVELARCQPGCCGSRLAGAGWGGATVNLVQTSDVPSFIANVARAYLAETGIEPWGAPVRASQDAGWLDSFKEM